MEGWCRCAVAAAGAWHLYAVSQRPDVVARAEGDAAPGSRLSGGGSGLAAMNVISDAMLTGRPNL